MEKARAAGTLPADAAEAGLLSPHLLRPAPPLLDSVATGDPNGHLKSEPVHILRPNDAGDHDDYTIAPKRRKLDPV